jgi:hypothetical protein
MQRKSCKVRYSAHVTLSDGTHEVELVVRRSIVGGIDGPFVSARLPGLANVEAWLSDRGFSASAWRTVKGVAGMQIEADLAATRKDAGTVDSRPRVCVHCGTTFRAGEHDVEDCALLATEMPAWLEAHHAELNRFARGRYALRNEAKERGHDDVAQVHHDFGDRFLLSALAITAEWES